MRPDRIVVGEVRGGEALDMMQAMNTGHDGSISTVHANSARDAISRLETMMLMAGISLPERALREQIASAVDLIVQLTRLSDGSRKLVEFSEVTGMEGNTITTQMIFKFQQRGVENGKVMGISSPRASCRRSWTVWSATVSESPILTFCRLLLGGGEGLYESIRYYDLFILSGSVAHRNIFHVAAGRSEHLAGADQKASDGDRQNG
jgi:hypothetical protein